MLVAFGRGASDGGDARSVIARSRETATTYAVKLMVVRGAAAARGRVGGLLRGPSDPGAGGGRFGPSALLICAGAACSRRRRSFDLS